MGFRDRLARRLFPETVAAVEHAVNILEAAGRRGPYSWAEEDVVRALMEADSYLIDWVLKQRNYQLLNYSTTEVGENDRLRAVDEARHMYLYDVLTHRAVNTWTDFGFGQKVEVVPKDPGLDEVWSEFWSARRNAPVLGQRSVHRLSNQLINDGELFLVVFGSKLPDGKSTVRVIDTKQVSEIKAAEDDPDIPLYYVRQKVAERDIWYPDWRATPQQLKMVDVPDSARLASDLSSKVAIGGKPTAVTSVVILHVAYDDVNGRGWPVLSRVYEWSRVMRNFLADRAAVSKRVATFVDEFTHPAGSRATDAIAAKFNTNLSSSTWGIETNPLPPAGSTLVHNKALEVARRPLTTGAGDALSDGQMFGGQVSVGTGVPLHWMGQPQALANRATAREMRAPWSAQLSRYKLFWADVFGELVEIVGRNTGQEFEDYGADVTLSSPEDVEVEEITAGIDALTKAMMAFAIDGEFAKDANNKLAERLLSVLGVATSEDEQPAEEEGGETEEAALWALAEAAAAGQEAGLTGAELTDWILQELERGRQGDR